MKCPKCGGKAVKISYGYPTSELGEKAERGEVVLGGCGVSDDDKKWQCLECGYKWGSTNE